MTSSMKVCLAAERPELEAVGVQFCLSMLPGTLVDHCSLAELAECMETADDTKDLAILVLQADEEGHLSRGSTMIQSVMTSSIPVLVLRHQEGTSIETLQRIVVPLDGSTTASQAIPIASRFAKRLHLPVHFVMVIDPSRVIPPAYTYDPDAWSMIEDLRETSHWALQQSEELIRRDGVQVDSTIMFGPINASLASLINPTDLVVMTTHGPHREGLRYRDSVTQRALVSIPAPMIVMRASPHAQIANEGYAACSWIEPLQREVSVS